MKNLFFLLLAFSFFMTACNNNKPKETTVITSKDGKEKVTVNTGNLKKEVMDIADIQEALSKLTPLTLEELKAFIPEQILGAAKSNYQATSAQGMGSVSAEYKIDEKTKIKLSIIDCAGSMGAGAYTIYNGMLSFERDTENEYSKVIEFNGGKAMESCKKKRDECTLDYFTGNRYMVNIKGDNVGMDVLKQVGKDLNLK